MSKEEFYKAREVAFRLLAVRARSAWELRKRLREKKFPAEVIEHVLAELQDKGYQSDLEFARLYAREKWSGSGWGPVRVRHELLARGISRDLLNQVLDEIYKEVDLVEGVLPLAEKKWRSTEGLPLDARRRRLTGFLQRRGYKWEVINRLFNRLESSGST